jgi:3-deoxy-manno-octulosonate cytidylyltransferase (CMP-KDO synthetase)
MNPIVVIPSRMAATRLPGKPLADINGIAMIVHVLNRGREARIGPVAVACAEPEIATAVRLDPHGVHDVVVNLQGDLPTIPSDYIRAVLAPLADPSIDIATLVAPITTDEEAHSPSVVKAACAFDGGRAVSPALYFSRATIPSGPGPLWHHIGIYAFRRQALARFVALPESPLEKRESLEQLRALEAGMRIACARVEHAPFGVDTPADLERARAALPFTEKT